MTTLPFLLSIPHGGTVIPKELKSRIRLSSQELLADGDPFTGEIYDMEGYVQAQFKFDFARALIDVNRSPDDLPPGNPDGMVKTVSIFNNPVYKTGQVPDTAEISSLLGTYYQPFHMNIQDALQQYGLVFAFDCHSMEAVGPPIAKDAGRKRPLFCLGNNNGKACPDETVHLFADCLSEAFHIPSESITLNDPFSGGYITQRYGGKTIPWMQIELNRGLYLTEPWYQKEQNIMNRGRLQQLNISLRKAFHLFNKEYEAQT